MSRNKTEVVRDAWGGYQHGTSASDAALGIARGLLNHSIPDPTGGATHFYSPGSMPKEGAKTDKFDVGGGLESVPGVAGNGKPIRNYSPGWTAKMEARPVRGVPEKTFKFFRDKDDGYIR